jgi:putative addiction module component (TIGR02574 family)
MTYDKEELLSLPVNERIALAEELWSSIEDEELPITDEEIAFVEERLRLHHENPGEGMSLEEFKRRFG